MVEISKAERFVNERLRDKIDRRFNTEPLSPPVALQVINTDDKLKFNSTCDEVFGKCDGLIVLSPDYQETELLDHNEWEKVLDINYTPPSQEPRESEEE